MRKVTVCFRMKRPENDISAQVVKRINALFGEDLSNLSKVREYETLLEKELVEVELRYNQT